MKTKPYPHLSVFFIITISLFIPVILTAAQSSYQFSPPPIPWFEFKEGQKDTRAGGTFLYLTGKVDEDEYSGNVKVYGLGGSLFYRNAFRHNLAFHTGASAAGAAGDIGPYADMNLGIFTVPLGLEFQPVKTPEYVFIIFGGFNFTWTHINIQVDDGEDEAELTMKSRIQGPQFGAQISIKQSDFVFSPFFMITSLSGRANVKLEYNDSTIFSGSTSVPSTTARFYGLDITYVPMSITLSSLIQQLSSSGNNKGFRTYVVSLTYNFHTPGKDQGSL